MYSKKQSGGRRKKLLAAACIAIVIIIILLLLRCCAGGDGPDLTEQGQFNISDVLSPPKQTEEPTDAEPETITFTGCGVYEVSASAPNIALENPAVNAFSFVFTLTDNGSGAVIARTGHVLPGEAAYIDVVDYFAEVGEYETTVNIAAFSDSDRLMTSLNQEMTIKIKSE